MTSTTSPVFKYDSLQWGVGNISPLDKNLSGRKLSLCLENIRDVKGRILEVGCARGQFIRSIKRCRPDLDVYGCDINDLAIQENSKENAEGIHYSVGDAVSLPYEDGFFDAVVFFDVLEHLLAPEQFLSEMYRVLKPGGKVHGYIPCEGQPGTIHWLLWKIRIGHDLKKKHRGHIQRFTLANCGNLFFENHFKIQRTQRSGYWIEQALDILFYVFLECTATRTVLWDAHADPGTSSENKKEGALHHLFVFLRDLAFGVGFYETSLFSFIPFSLGLHLTATKEPA